MKKNTLFLLTGAIVFTLLVNVIDVNFALAYYDSGCGPNGPFSATTGKPCDTSSVIVCPAGHLYSAFTGQRCNSWQNATSGTATSQFQIGSRGESVKAFQQTLVNAGYSLKVDGIYGPITDRAAKSYYAGLAVSLAQADGSSSVLPASVATQNQIVTETSASTTDTTISATVPSVDVPATTPVVPPVTTTPSELTFSVSGPRYLIANQEGVWVASVGNKGQGTLSYSVNWGDGNTSSSVPQFLGVVNPPIFTHSYILRGATYNPVFTVISSDGRRASTSLSVTITGTDVGRLNIQPGKNVISAGGSVSLQAMYDGCTSTDLSLCPGPGASIKAVKAIWSSSNPEIGTVGYKSICLPNTICSGELTAVANAISKGMTIIIATYQSPLGPVTAWAPVTVK